MLLLFLGISPCEDRSSDLYEHCCHKWTRKVGNNLPALMKVMRMANQIGKSKLDLWSMLPNSEETLQALKYPLALNHGKSTQMDSRTMIPMCFFENFLEEESKRRFTEDSCNYFQPVFTDLGMCHAFNAKSVTDLLLDSYYKESFFEAFKHDLNPNETMHQGTKSGHSFNFYLMGNHGIRITSHGKGLYGKDQPPSKFMLGLSNHKEYFNLKASSKIVQAGFKIILNVQAMEIKPSETLKSLPIESRKCRFPEETDNLEIFKTYSQSACEFEYLLKKASEACRCTPWFIPHPSKKKHTICDVYGNYCFESIWNKNQFDVKDCLPGCHQLKFTSSEIRERLDAEYICTKGDLHSRMRSLAREVSKLNGYQLFNKIHSMKDRGNLNNTFNETQAEIDICQELVENEFAEVSVMFERPEFIRTKTSQRMAFADNLGVIGISKIKSNFETKELQCVIILYSYRRHTWSIYRNQHS